MSTLSERRQFAAALFGPRRVRDETKPGLAVEVHRLFHPDADEAPEPEPARTSRGFAAELFHPGKKD